MNNSLVQLLKSLYLGDRACKRVMIDGWNDRFGIQIDCISRLKAGTTTWDYYTDEDLIDGWLVLSGLASISITPSGPIPNDSIEIVGVRENEGLSIVDLSVGSVNALGEISEVVISLTATEASVETNEEFMTILKRHPE